MNGFWPALLFNAVTELDNVLVLTAVVRRRFALSRPALFAVVSLVALVRGSAMQQIAPALARPTVACPVGLYAFGLAALILGQSFRPPLPERETVPARWAGLRRAVAIAQGLFAVLLLDLALSADQLVIGAGWLPAGLPGFAAVLGGLWAAFLAVWGLPEAVFRSPWTVRAAAVLIALAGWDVLPAPCRGPAAFMAAAGFLLPFVRRSFRPDDG
ncbi:hypothetical protein AB1399_13250 [Hydrogenibacillus schlegelii]|uniref:Integral membrane protein n=1 Tax=Hydrogenibacillus schlegelii TaxID=1484 RepID=A0A132MGB1_HYDSH|nr:hypothetical protein [Hydrogenibacillus schlegelii]KWW96880.1 hypothetical protein TR75_11820 [Hydrogenibacillus schlegelii]OAR05292.1 hypothetical protein SA87_07940 [Hydrogenibacillus schlegelii]